MHTAESKIGDPCEAVEMPGYGKLWTPMENRVFHSRPHLPTALGKRSDLDDSISSFPTFPQPLLLMFCKKKVTNLNQDLTEVWKKSIDLAVDCYQLLHDFPRQEQ